MTRDAQLGHAFNNPSVKVNFPLGNSVQDQKDRITASIIALQNLNGPGKGCPGVSTTLSLQSAALDQGKAVPAPSPAPPPASSAAPSSAPPAAASSPPAKVAVVSASTQSAPASSPAPPAPSANNNGNASVNGITRDIVAKLAPDLGSQPNNNPNSTFRLILIGPISEPWFYRVW